MSSIRCTMEAVNLRGRDSTSHEQPHRSYPAFPTSQVFGLDQVIEHLQASGSSTTLVSSTKMVMIKWSLKIMATMWKFSLCVYFSYLILRRYSINSSHDELDSKLNTWFFSQRSSQSSYTLLLSKKKKTSKMEWLMLHPASPNQDLFTVLVPPRDRILNQSIRNHLNNPSEVTCLTDPLLLFSH